MHPFIHQLIVRWANRTFHSYVSTFVSILSALVHLVSFLPAV